MSNPAKDNLLDDIMSYEDGDLNGDEMLALFQKLVNNGMAWKLQGRYGRTAIDLIDNGLIQPAPSIDREHI